MTRLVAAVAAAILSLALTFTTDSATAQVSESAHSARAGWGTFNVKLVHGRLRAHGQAHHWARKIVLVQRAPRHGGRWVTVARVRTDRRGNFGTTLHAHSDIPCTGRGYVLRAKNRHGIKRDEGVWSC